MVSGAVVVVGEALIDLVAQGGGSFAGRPGGGPYNMARTIARLGAPASFAGRLSGDCFGSLLRERLAADGVGLAIPEPSEMPTTLAVVDLDGSGSARYSFYLEKTSAADVSYDHLAGAIADPEAPAGPAAVAINGGALGFVLDPIASSVERFVAEALPARTPLMVDPNCRPMTVRDRDAYVARLSRVFRRADIVKASTEDLAYLFPDLSPDGAAVALLDQGTSLVLITDGARPARGYLAGAEEISVPVPRVEVVDTIGAGDAFGGAFLTAWTQRHHGDGGSAELRNPARDTPAAVREALTFAAEVAARTCTRPGAEPPFHAELMKPLGS